MFHIRDDGEKSSFGFNFYPLSSESSVGFKFKLAEGKGFAVRYSKVCKRWFFWGLWLSNAEIEASNRFLLDE